MDFLRRVCGGCGGVGGWGGCDVGGWVLCVINCDSIRTPCCQQNQDDHNYIHGNAPVRVDLGGGV